MDNSHVVRVINLESVEESAVATSETCLDSMLKLDKTSCFDVSQRSAFHDFVWSEFLLCCGITVAELTLIKLSAFDLFIVVQFDGLYLIDI